ncbi:hypothetical protein SteCoe_7277 [Stentor coeruleus]|uniref:Uncharacterized protein n=1 Tax=Stentor coeruleus TaxID=5963 RepID=A0A1R2CMW9_9CILI|nr:hypothetical protein SteCoe_7277 [Stentor coeruleus]
MSSADVAKKLDEVSMSRVSISEAIKELELSREAFSHAGQIQDQLKSHESWINEIKYVMESVVTFNFFNTRMEEFAHAMDRAIKARVDELSVSVINQLNNKVTMADADNLLSKKVSWNAYSTLSQQVGLLKSRMDKHIFSDFEGFKTKIKLELTNKNNDKKTADIGSNEEIVQLKSRINTIEQQIQQMFNEEDLMDDEHDSQEELDNMMDDLERAVAKNTKSNDFIEDTDLNDDAHEFECKSPKGQSGDNDKLQIDDKNLSQFKADGITPRNRDSRSIVRKNSKESSSGSRLVGGTSGAIRQLNKKILTISKDFEDHKADFDNFRIETQKLLISIAELEAKFEETNEKFKSIDERLEIMQASFLRALRRSGKPKEISEIIERKQSVRQSNSKDIDSITKIIDDKFKRIIKVENDHSRFSNDLLLMKNFVREKLSGLSSSAVMNTDILANMQKELESMKKKVLFVESELKEKIEEVNREVAKIKGPMVDMVSDLNRESATTQEEIKRNQDVIRSLIEDYQIRPQSQLSYKPAVTESLKSDFRCHTRANSATPTVSIKRRYNKVLSIHEKSDRICFK